MSPFQEYLQKNKITRDGIKNVSIATTLFRNLIHSEEGSGKIRMKDRLISYLILKAGFDIFGIEVNMPEAYEINQYVFNNIENLTSLIGGMGFWTWCTKEMLALVKWMNENNKKGNPKISFTGFDM